MKNFIFILIGIVFLASYSCSNEESFLTNNDFDFIDFNTDEPYESQTAVIQLAAERLDKYVSYKNGQYIMKSCKPEAIGLSATVYRYMQQLMEYQNKEIVKYKDWDFVDNKTFISYGELEFMPRILSRSEAVITGGVTTAVCTATWHGLYVDVYISNSTLRTSTNLLSAAAAIAASAPDPSATKIVTMACSLSALVCNQLAGDYPNGIVISVYAPLYISGCIPYSLRGQ